MFKTILQRAATFVIALASLAACDAAPLTAPQASALPGEAAATTISRDAATVPYSFVVFASCVNGGDGEVLQVSGQLEYEGHWITTTTHGERRHFITRASFTGLGTGWDSGDEYDVVSREFWQGNTDYGSDGIPDKSEDLQRLRLRATNRATGGVFEVVLVGRFVQTATGEFVLDGWEARARCE